MVSEEKDVGADRWARVDTVAEEAGPSTGAFDDGLESQAGVGPRRTRLPAIGARMSKDSPEQPAGKADDKGSGADKSNGSSRPRAKGARSSTAFDLWLQRELQDMFSDVSREPVPDELMRLIDESKSVKK